MQDFSEILKKQQKNEIERKEKYGKIRPIIHVNHRESKFVAVGSRVGFSKKWKTFTDFLMDYIKDILGRSWGDAELKKPPEERHEILKWYERVCNFQLKQTKGQDGIYSVVPNGVFSAYLSLAYDLYILEHHKAIQEDIIRRLKLSDQFHGARYELFVTATCIRAGFDIKFENEKDRSGKHPEFIAIHKDTGQKISVEAKSKKRDGILGRFNLGITDDKVRLRVGKCINQASAKKSSYPLVVFIDVNLSPNMALKIMKMPSPNKISETVDRIKKTSDGKDIFNLLVFTNHPHHYGRDDEPDPKKNILSFFSEKPQTIINHPKTLWDLHQATLQYGNIPSKFPEKS